MDESIEEQTSVSETLPKHLLRSIEREQLMWMMAVDSVWRLSTVMLICSAIMAPSIDWLRASVLLLTIGVGTFIVEREVLSRKKAHQNASQEHAAFGNRKPCSYGANIC